MIYLDNAATSFPKPPCVTQAVVEFMQNIGASAGRGAYKSAQNSGNLLFSVRERLARLLGNKQSAQNIFFTYNTTYALNLVLHGILEQNDNVLITQIEHNALMRPLKFLEHTKGIKIRQIPTTAQCGLNLTQAKELSKGVKLIACIGANNVTGAIMPLDSLKEIAQESGAFLLIDAAQILGVSAFENDGVDIVCGSAHKGLLAPMGLGICALSQRAGQYLEPLILGGTGSASESLEQPKVLPDKFESGTQNMHAIAGLDSALVWLENVGVEKIFLHENTIRAYFIEGLRCIEGVGGIKICEIESNYKSTGVLSFTCADIAKMAHLLDKHYGICVRAGLHCNPCTHKTIDTLATCGTIRLSPSYTTTFTDAELTLKAIAEIAKILKTL
ncbi:aminotransferase class V-fold PLP-dependent enzyme [Helicobacter himalayensis]|uniref:aminotransferase class V-fold PLP-dependent enzyme n=1 Tax=Helicobacter himalayensis TaxID=1591088 RepID=UPI000833BCD9|nr:aminotransferase class V-fold PLP-dependent enzyme [Helicobacter himalayensis]